MRIVRRILALAAISVTGVALLAPLAARSATPMATTIEEHLLTVDDAPAVAADRGTLSARDGALLEIAAPTDGAEALDGGPMPTPASAPMEATLVSTATPPPAPAPPAPAPPAPAPVTYSGSSVWDDLAQCESGGNWAINTGNGYYGGLQFSYDTWHGYDGGEFADYPHQATREQQILVAERLRAERGYAPWPACRAKLGLP
jgi:Transglycosylase-like domain